MKALTVGDLKKKLEGVPNNTVLVTGDTDDMLQLINKVGLAKALESPYGELEYISEEDEVYVARRTIGKDACKIIDCFYIEGYM